jgi:hypothetical protein
MALHESCVLSSGAPIWHGARLMSSLAPELNYDNDVILVNSLNRLRP